MAKWANAQAPSFGHIGGVAVLSRAAEENDSQGRSVLFVRKESKEEEEKGVQLWICLIANYLFVLNDGCNREIFLFQFLLGIYHRKEPFQGSRSSSICGPPPSSANKQVEYYLIDCSVE